MEVALKDSQLEREGCIETGEHKNETVGLAY